MKNKFGVIYKATNIINGKAYIGQTWNFKRRYKEHPKYKRCILFYNALKKYGIENFRWDIISKTDDQNELNELEKKLILEYKTHNKEYGYNLKMGGAGSGFNLDTIIKMKKSSKIFWSKSINRVNASLSQKKRFENIKEREKHSLARGGKPFWAKKEDEMLFFKTQSEAAKKLNVNRRHLQSALKDDRGLVGGWKFSYKDLINYKYPKKKKIIATKGKIILEFQTQSEAAKKLKIHQGTISSMLLGKRKYSINNWWFSYDKPYNKNNKLIKKEIIAKKDNKVIRFTSQAEASRALGIHKNVVNNVLSKITNKTRDGWCFSYTN